MEKKFCAICMKEVEVRKEIRLEKRCVRGVDVEAELTFWIDDHGHQIFDYETEENNDFFLYEEYKKIVGLLTAAQIKAIRSKYGLSAELFAKALGMGLKSITRFENGSIQSRETNGLLLLVQEPSNFLKVVNSNKERLTDKEYQRCLDGCDKTEVPLFIDYNILSEASFRNDAFDKLFQNMIESMGNYENQFVSPFKAKWKHGNSNFFKQNERDIRA